ncbi:MAG: sensor histidine kinase [Spirochaetota bacterium]
MAETDPEEIRDRIIGLGAGSARKNYYPQLQEKIRDLELKQQELMDLVRTLEERETMLEQLVDEKNALLKEVHHRVKNNFQIMGSLLNLGLDAVSSESEALAFVKTKRRLDSMALVYGQLLQAEHFSEVDLRGLVTQVVNSLYNDARLPGVELLYGMACPDLYQDVDRAIPLTLIVTEVASNAFDHAFPDGKGRLRVRLTEGTVDEADESGQARHLLEIADDGCGFPGGTMPSLNSSLGLTLIDSLATQLKASWSYGPGMEGRGLGFRLTFT